MLIGAWIKQQRVVRIKRLLIHRDYADHRRKCAVFFIPFRFWKCLDAFCVFFGIGLPVQRPWGQQHLAHVVSSSDDKRAFNAIWLLTWWAVGDSNPVLPVHSSEGINASYETNCWCLFFPRMTNPEPCIGPCVVQLICNVYICMTQKAWSIHRTGLFLACMG